MAKTTLVEGAKNQLDNLKWETASEIGVNLQRGYNGTISAKDAGRIGGNMVRKLIQKAEQSL
ncbi:MAG: alpha/beta-type small acid-soluble spore protein [Thermaerobacter sp.]|jgi:hypothetical protein|nr:alpha/beta-type small acid-soluble spore protein [Thermaerobacter sp.]